MSDHPSSGRCWLIPGLLLGALALTVLAWRQFPHPATLGLSALVLLLIAIWTINQPQSWKLAIPILFLAALVAPMISLEALWPCGLACQGALHYSSFAGVPVWALGLLTYSITFFLLLAGLRGDQQRFRLAGGILLALCAGGSLWYLWLSWQLELLCNHCLALHTLALAAMICAVRLLSFERLLTLVALGFFALHMVFHHQPVVDAAPVAAPISEQRADPEVAAAMSAAMRIGEAQAEIELHLVLDPICPHCRSVWRQLAEGLGPLIGDGSAQLHIRIRHNPRLPISRFAAEMLVAAGLTNHLGHGGYLAGAIPHLIGFSQRDSEAMLRSRWAASGFFNAEPALQLRQLVAGGIAQHLDSEARWLEGQRLLTAATPVLILRRGDIRQQWSGDLPIEGIRQRIIALSADKE
ncbi:MAG: hypothetical protein EA402_14080 [Planctomycetota bacterium]|nr:MAG: hypothetical protein EA402_14080 [Planctomycetota bacterium]